MLRRGISPVIATVIIVAVALILSVALAGWVMGIWGTLGTTEALQIVTASLNDTQLNITILNKGSASAKVVALTVENGSATLISDDCKDKTIVGNGVTSLNCTLTGGAVSGYIYTIRLVTYGGTYTYDVRAK
ncbi:MAG: archaellin/type IV pilin N-terminal domain-containing protein [Sulfolobales archaeon]